MSFRALFCLSAVILLAGAVSTAQADVPQLINYQGVLLDSGGQPVTTPVNVIFAIWDDPAAGDSLWSEEQTVSPDANGLFNVLLGSDSPIPDSAFSSADMYLSVKVDTDPEMTPRQRLASVAYSYRSATADAGGSNSGWVHHGDIVRLATETDSVGIGTSTPGQKLEVNGTVKMTGFDLPTGAANGLVLTSDANGVGTWEAASGGGSNWTVADSVLYTNNYLGIARGGIAGNILYGDSTFTMVNLGVACTTGQDGLDIVYSTIGGGMGNVAMQGYTTVAGGKNNTADLNYSTVAGGVRNFAHHYYSAVAGGIDNTATGESSTVPGGRDNTAQGNYSFAAGRRAKAYHSGTFVWADDTDADFASTGAKQFLIRAAGGVGIGTTTPTEKLDVVGNILVSGKATVGPGHTNTGTNAFVAGRDNAASGDGSIVAGGRNNAAAGDYSFAAGFSAEANHHGAFVWNDSKEHIPDIGQIGTHYVFASETENQFAACAHGGARFVTALDRNTGNPTAGVQVAGGGSSWSSISDRNAKENFDPVDARDVLEKVASFPISTWNYKAQDESIRHMGPMAQDLYDAFGLGIDERHINTIDADGIALAAIQGLYQENVDLKERVEQLEALVKQLLAK